MRQCNNCPFESACISLGPPSGEVKRVRRKHATLGDQFVQHSEQDSALLAMSRRWRNQAASRGGKSAQHPRDDCRVFYVAQTLMRATTPNLQTPHFKGSLGGNSVETRENVHSGYEEVDCRFFRAGSCVSF
jgi:hypothetical protein